MNNDRELLQQALDALEEYVPQYNQDNKPVGNVMQDIRARLAQPESMLGKPIVYSGSSKHDSWNTTQPEQEPVAMRQNGAAFVGHGAVIGKPEQEPVAFVCFKNGEVDYESEVVISNTRGDCMDDSTEWRPVYTAPPQREEGCAECGKQASDGWALYCVKCIENYHA